MDLRVIAPADPMARTGELAIDGVGRLGIVLTGGAAQPGWWALGGARWTDLRRTVDTAHGPIDLGELIALDRAQGL